MLKVKPHSMNNGRVTQIQISNENFHEIVDISPLPFELISEKSTQDIISRFCLKKQQLENLVQQMELAHAEYETALNEFKNLTGQTNEKSIHENNTIISPIPAYHEKIQTKEEPKPEPPEPPEPEVILKPPEPITETESIISAPEPIPPTAQEIALSIISQDEFKALIDSKNLSDDTIRALITKNTNPEMVDTIHELIITELKENGVHGFKLEPTLWEKGIAKVKKIRGRPSKKEGVE